MSRRKRKAADFPSEFLDAWKLAVQGKLMLTMENAGMARNMIQRLYMFRRALLEEAPQLAAPFMLVDLRVHDEAGNIITAKATRVPGKAIIRPYQPVWKEQIREQLSESGSGVPTSVEPGDYTVPITSPAILTPAQSLPSVGEVSKDNVGETLSDLGYGTGEDR